MNLSNSTGKINNDIPLYDQDEEDERSGIKCRKWSSNKWKPLCDAIMRGNGEIIDAIDKKTAS